MQGMSENKVNPQTRTQLPGARALGTPWIVGSRSGLRPQDRRPGQGSLFKVVVEQVLSLNRWPPRSPGRGPGNQAGSTALVPDPSL